MFQLVKDGKVICEYSTAPQIVAEILVRGWFEPVERFGVCWIKGVEIRKAP